MNSRQRHGPHGFGERSDFFREYTLSQKNRRFDTVKNTLLTVSGRQVIEPVSRLSSSLISPVHRSQQQRFIGLHRTLRAEFSAAEAADAFFPVYFRSLLHDGYGFLRAYLRALAAADAVFARFRAGRNKGLGQFAEKSVVYAPKTHIAQRLQLEVADLEFIDVSCYLKLRR
jgi:hypothetical protein